MKDEATRDFVSIHLNIYLFQANKSRSVDAL